MVTKDQARKNRLTLLRNGTWTQDEFNAAETWDNKIWPPIEWDHVTSIHIKFTYPSEIHWNFSFWKGKFPGVRGIIYPFMKHCLHCFNPERYPNKRMQTIYGK